MAVTSYPGTVTPLRGLSAFTESERDVFWGREKETSKLARLVTIDGYRAGLLHGLSGVGKTSLLRAGLLPHLRDHGVVALFCRENTRPAAALAAEFTAATNKVARENESAVAFLARVVSESMKGQQYLFILDDIDRALASRDDTVIGELADLFARVVTRSGGRARFLFSADSTQIHHFSILEQRTGSLFPPNNRLQLEAFSPEVATTVFERMTSLSGLTTDVPLAHQIAGQLNQGAPILPADLQIAAMAMTALAATNSAAIDHLGGPAELGKQWLLKSAETTSDQQAALRLLGQLAQGKGKARLTPSWAASHANVKLGFATTALDHLADSGVLRRCQATGDDQPRYQLAHSILAPRLRILAAPAQAAAQRAFELLGSKAEAGGVLGLREWFEVAKQRIEPTNEKENAVLLRTKRLVKILAAIAVAVPLLFLALMYSCNSGHRYLDVAVDQTSTNTTERVVVRDGRPGLSMFHWLGFGNVVADTGFNRQMAASKSWSEIADEEIVFSDDDISTETMMAVLSSTSRALVEFATNGDEENLRVLTKNAETIEQRASLFDVLAMVGRGGPGEQEIVAQALADDSPAVRISALRLAATIEGRHPDSYSSLLASELASSKVEKRRLAVSVVRGLAKAQATHLWQAALARTNDPQAKSELAEFVTGAKKVSNPVRLANVLAAESSKKTAKKNARHELTRLLIANPSLAIGPLTQLATNTSADKKARIWALQTLFDHGVFNSTTASDESDDNDSDDDDSDDNEALLSELKSDDDSEIKAAALPLAAQIDPETVKGELAIMTESTATPKSLRAAVALAWGEVAKVDLTAAAAALNKLLEDRSSSVRRAAARSFGKLGRVSQSKLIEMIKKERLEVAEGAAFGLVESTSGGGTSSAVQGIALLWKKKGAARRRATQAFARLARTKPKAASTYLALAARDKEDPSLHPIGVQGLCNALFADGRRAAREMLEIAGNNSSTIAIRRSIGECASDLRKSHPVEAIKLATKLLGDSDERVRLEAVQTLAALAGQDVTREAVASRIGVALTDSSRSVRIACAEGIAKLGVHAPADLSKSLPAIFAKAGEAEKMALLRAAEAVGAAPLVPLALADPSDRVRARGLALALTDSNLANTALQSALTDSSPSVRSQALQALASHRDSLTPDLLARSLSLAARDPSAEIGARAIQLFAEVGEPSVVAGRLEEMLGGRVDSQRRAAAAAVRGLAIGSPTRARELLASALTDSARDVRAEATISLGHALAQEFTSVELGKQLRGAELKPSLRVAIAAAFVIKAKTDQRESVIEVLGGIIDGGPQMATIVANLSLGLIEANADALSFLAWFAP